MRETDDLYGKLQRAYPAGVPNLFRTLMGNPAVARGFIALDDQLEADGVLTPAERLTVGLITALHMDCAYCRAALSKEAAEAGAPADVIAAILRDTVPDDARPRALLTATRRLVETKGRLPRAECAHFARMGLGEAALLEIIAVIGVFTIATHANNLMRTRIDPEYRGGDAAAAQA